MKTKKTYSFYSYSHRSRVRVKAFNLYEALVISRFYDPFVDFCDLRLVAFH